MESCRRAQGDGKHLTSNPSTQIAATHLVAEQRSVTDKNEKLTPMYLIKNGNHRGARAIDLFRFRNKIACLIDINHFLKTNSVLALE